jgi:hypothetical protein
MPIIIALMMKAASTSETSVDIQLRTQQYIPEDSELHTRRRENLKSQIYSFIFGNTNIKVKNATAVPLHATKALGRRGCIAPTHSRQLSRSRMPTI